MRSSLNLFLKQWQSKAVSYLRIASISSLERLCALLLSTIALLSLSSSFVTCSSFISSVSWQLMPSETDIGKRKSLQLKIVKDKTISSTKMCSKKSNLLLWRAWRETNVAHRLHFRFETKNRMDNLLRASESNFYYQFSVYCKSKYFLIT